MSDGQREIYHSENGDKWLLCRGADNRVQKSVFGWQGDTDRNRDLSWARKIWARASSFASVDRKFS